MTTPTPSQMLHAIADRLHHKLTAAQVTLIRTDMRRLADGPITAQEIALAEIVRNEAEQADMAERHARLTRPVVVAFRSGAIPVRFGDAS